MAAAALSIPGAVILTLAAGAMFGLGWGLLLVSFASSLGALLAFLSALLMLASSRRVLGRVVHVAARRTNALLGLTLLSSVAFYPAMYLGAALGNSRPIVYAQPGYTRLG